MSIGRIVYSKMPTKRKLCDVYGFGLPSIILVFVSTILLKVAFYYSIFLWLHFAKSKGSLKRLKQPKPRYGPSLLINMLTALKGSHFYFYLISLLTLAAM